MTVGTVEYLSSLAGVRMRPGAGCAVLLCAAVAGQVIASPGGTGDGRVDGSRFGGVLEWVDRQHGQLSEQVLASATAIDRFFATEDYLQDTTESYLRLVADVGYDTRDGSSSDLKLRGRLDLPGTERRFTVLISGVSDDPLTGDDPLAEGGSQGAIALERNPRDGSSDWQLRPGVGLRGGWTPDAFVQLRATRHIDLGEGWSTRTQGLVRYLVDDRWDLRGDFNVLKVIDERRTGRVRTDLGWREVDRFARATQSFDLFVRVSERLGLRHTVSVSADDQSDWRVVSYGYRFSWRRLIHRDWLYMEVSPEVYFPREDDFEAAAAVNLRFEAFAGGYR